MLDESIQGSEQDETFEEIEKNLERDLDQTQDTNSGNCVKPGETDKNQFEKQNTSVVSDHTDDEIEMTNENNI